MVLFYRMRGQGRCMFRSLSAATIALLCWVGASSKAEMKAATRGTSPSPAAASDAGNFEDGGCRSATAARSAPVLLQTSAMHRHSDVSAEMTKEGSADGCDVCPPSPYHGSTIEIINNCGFTTNVHTDAGVGGRCRWDGTNFPPCLRNLQPGGRATVHLKEEKGIYSFQIGQFGNSTRFEIARWLNTWGISSSPTDSFDVSYNAGFDIGMTVILPDRSFVPKIVCTHDKSPAAYQLGGDGCQVQPCVSPTWNGPPGRYELYLCNRPGDVDTPGPCGCRPCPGIPCDPTEGRSDCTTSGGGIYCQVGGGNCPTACGGLPTQTGTGDCVATCPIENQGAPVTNPPLPGPFFPVDGGTDRACRGDNLEDSQERYFIVHSVSTLAECESLCISQANCMGIEFSVSVKRCEVWTRPEGIGTAVWAPGYSCFRYSPSQTSKTTTTTTALIPGDGFAPVDGGVDRACRGASPGDNSYTYYRLTSAASLAACEAACLAESDCQGVEYNPNGRCELWTRPGGIRASAEVGGFMCLRRTAPATTTAPAPPTTCRTAQPGDECYPHVIWAMEWGILLHPEWYPGLSASSSFEDFQVNQHNSQSHSDVCPMPCQTLATMSQGSISQSHAEREWLVASYNMGWQSDGTNDLPSRADTKAVLEKLGQQRVTLLGLQECAGVWPVVQRLAAMSLDYLTPLAPAGHLCGAYDPAVFEPLASGVENLWQSQRLQWVRLQEHETGRKVLFLNLLWQHTGGASVKPVQAQNTSQIIRDRAEPGDVVVVSGNFNASSDAFKADASLLPLGLRVLGSGQAFGGMDVVWSSQEPWEDGLCDVMQGAAYPLVCRLHALGSSYRPKM